MLGYFFFPSFSIYLFFFSLFFSFSIFLNQNKPTKNENRDPPPFFGRECCHAGAASSLRGEASVLPGMLPGHSANLPSPGRTTKYWGKHFPKPLSELLFIFKKTRMRGVGGGSLARSVHRRRQRGEGIYAPKFWTVMEKLRSRNKNKRGKINSCLYSPSPPSWRRLWSKMYLYKSPAFGFCFFLQGFMLNLLVAGVSRGQGWSRTRADFSL